MLEVFLLLLQSLLDVLCHVLTAFVSNPRDFLCHATRIVASMGWELGVGCCCL